MLGVPINTLIFIFLAFFVNTSFSASSRMIPNSDLNAGLEGGPDALKALLSTHIAVYPGSFPHRDIIYMTNLDRMVYHQSELIQKLSALPQYQEHIQQRGPMFDFVITAKKDYEFIAKEFDRFELDRIGEKIQYALESVPGKKIFKGLRDIIVKGFPLYAQGRLDYYDSKRYEEKIVAMVLLYGISNHGKKSDVLTKDIRLEEGHIDYLSEEKVSLPILKSLSRSFEGSERETFTAAAKGILERWDKRLKGDSASNQKTFYVQKGTVLHLIEVHPDLSVLRGFVGNDCSTDVSFGYPYSPFERNYYVTDADHNFLGYLALSIVEFRGKRTLFFHTIAGPNISHGAADMLVRAVFSARNTIGGEYMVLPEDRRIAENINFRPIEEVMRKSVRDVAAEPVVWLDKEYREIISRTGSSSFYDDPDRNRLGRFLDTTTDEIEVTFTSKPFVSPLEGNPAFPADLNCRSLLKPYYERSSYDDYDYGPRTYGYGGWGGY
jgi:hypothetical protein